jgi:hypothetical protein
VALKSIQLDDTGFAIGTCSGGQNQYDNVKKLNRTRPINTVFSQSLATFLF